MAMQNPNQQFDPLLNQYYGFQLVLTKKSLFFKSIVYKIRNIITLSYDPEL